MGQEIVVGVTHASSFSFKQQNWNRAWSWGWTL